MAWQTRKWTQQCPLTKTKLKLIHSLWHEHLFPFWVCNSQVCVHVVMVENMEVKFIFNGWHLNLHVPWHCQVSHRTLQMILKWISTQTFDEPKMHCQCSKNHGPRAPSNASYPYRSFGTRSRIIWELQVLGMVTRTSTWPCSPTLHHTEDHFQGWRARPRRSRNLQPPCIGIGAKQCRERTVIGM